MSHSSLRNVSLFLLQLPLDLYEGREDFDLSGYTESPAWEVSIRICMP